jgi:ABC-2 type transport system ATP-binding protein
MTEIAIRTDNLTRNFKRLRAVDGLTMEVARGTLFGFLGPNGAGKTTTIRLLLGLLEPTLGSATVVGFDTATQADCIRERSGALLEHHGLYERINAEDNLEFYGRINHLSKSERQARIKDLLTNLGLWERRKENVGTWSKGMKQKLAIARALLHRPPLLFLDEPTAGFDPVAAAAFHDDLLGLAKRENVTVFLTTHNLSEAEKLCSQIGVIRQGKLLKMGSPDELRHDFGAPCVEIVGQGFSDQAIAHTRAQPHVADAEQHDGHLIIHLQDRIDVAPLIHLLVDEGVQIEEVRKTSATLEDVFLTLVKEEQA